MSSPLTQSIRPSGQGGDYTSLSSWEAQNLDLVTLDSASYAMIDGNWSGSSDTTLVSINGWNTNTTCSITVECIGTGSRHSGIWDNTKYQLIVSNDSSISVSEDYVTIVGLQIETPTTNAPDESTIKAFSLTSGLLLIDSCLMRGTNGTGSGTYNDAVNAYNNSTHWTEARNCVGFNFRSGQSSTFSGWSANLRLYNCTSYRCATGFLSTGTGTRVVKNCLSQASSVDFSGIWTTSSYNISSGSTAPGSNSLTSSIVSFVDASSYNFRIADNDTAAKGNGYDLYNNGLVTWNNDIVGVTRTSGSWDIGAFAYVGGVIYNPFYYDNITQTLYANSITSNPDLYSKMSISSGGDVQIKGNLIESTVLNGFKLLVTGDLVATTFVTAST